MTVSSLTMNELTGWTPSAYCVWQEGSTQFAKNYDTVVLEKYNVRARIQSNIFSDFLEMAEYLIKDEGLKDAAAVFAGGVLEQHIRSLCMKHGVATTLTAKDGKEVPKRLDSMNTDLAKAGVYESNDKKQITSWADIRNDAAHANYDKYEASQVTLMIQGIRDFMARNPS